MPKVLVDEAKSHEISVTIQFAATELEQTFKKALLDSFTPENQQKLLQQGKAEVCVDCQVNNDGSLIMTGLAEDLNCRLHSPPMIIPDKIKNNEKLIKEFWQEVGDVIYDQGRITFYRNRDNEETRAGRSLTRSEAHQKLFAEVSAIKQVVDHERDLDAFVSAIKSNDIAVIGGNFFSASQGVTWDEDDLNGLESHPEYASIQTQLSAFRAEANEQRAQIKEDDNTFGF